jgi:hypothetical protein
MDQTTNNMVVVIGVLHDNDYRLEEVQATEFCVLNTEDACRQIFLLDKYEVPCYVAVGTDDKDLTILARNNTLVKFEQLQELAAIKAAGDLLGE